MVIGSIPIPGIFKLCGGMVYTLDSKSSASAYGFKSHHGHYIRSSSDSLMVKRLAHNELIVGLSPTQRILYALIFFLNEFIRLIIFRNFVIDPLNMIYNNYKAFSDILIIVNYFI